MKFTATFSSVTVDNAATLLLGYVKAATSKPFRIAKFEIAMQGKSDETKIPFKVQLVRVTSDGTGGATVYPTRMNASDGSPAATAKQATGGPPSAWSGAPSIETAANEGILGEWYVSPLSQNQEFLPAGWEARAAPGERLGLLVTNSDPTIDRVVSAVLYCEEV